jgi:hypothetical protein
MGDRDRQDNESHLRLVTGEGEAGSDRRDDIAAKIFAPPDDEIGPFSRNQFVVPPPAKPRENGHERVTGTTDDFFEELNRQSPAQLAGASAEVQATPMPGSAHLPAQLGNVQRRRQAPGARLPRRFAVRRSATASEDASPRPLSAFDWHGSFIHARRRLLERLAHLPRWRRARVGALAAVAGVALLAGGGAAVLASEDGGSAGRATPGGAATPLAFDTGVLAQPLVKVAALFGTVLRRDMTSIRAAAAAKRIPRSHVKRRGTPGSNPSAGTSAAATPQQPGVTRPSGSNTSQTSSSPTSAPQQQQTPSTSQPARPGPNGALTCISNCGT